MSKKMIISRQIQFKHQSLTTIYFH